jgi:hypothetical protein
MSDDFDDPFPQLPAADVQTAQLPASYEAAKAALARCERIDECKDWSDRAAALASYARQARYPELEDSAKRIRARAVRRMGELLLEIEPQQGARTDLGGPSRLSRKAAAEQAGLSKDQAKDALRLANIPQFKFEEFVESDQPPSVARLVKLAVRSDNVQPTTVRVEVRTAAAQRIVQSLYEIQSWADEAAEAVLIDKIAEELGRDRALQRRVSSALAFLRRLHERLSKRPAA